MENFKSEITLMGRKSTISDEELLSRLSKVFRDIGYEGATLKMLADATGLQKASLYHRFPDGKEQMAKEVLEHAGNWLNEQILQPLQGDGPAINRLTQMASQLDEFYSGGRQACLLNMLSSAHIHEGPFVESIKRVFQEWISTLTKVLVEAGIDRKTARIRSERAIIMLQGSLVFSRGTGSTKPFRDFLKSMPHELLAEDI